MKKPSDKFLLSAVVTEDELNNLSGVLPDSIEDALRTLGLPVTKEYYLALGWDVDSLDELEPELRYRAEEKLRRAGLLQEVE